MALFITEASKILLLILHFRFLYINKKYTDTNPITIREYIKSISVILIILVSMIIVILLSE